MPPFCLSSLPPFTLFPFLHSSRMSFLGIKNELYHSFLGSRERGFKDGQVELAKKCAEAAVNEKCDVLYRYEELNFSALIRDNQVLLINNEAHAHINIDTCQVFMI